MRTPSVIYTAVLLALARHLSSCCSLLKCQGEGVSVGELLKDSQLSAHLQGAPTALSHVRRGFSGLICDASGITDRINMWRDSFFISQYVILS